MSTGSTEPGSCEENRQVWDDIGDEIDVMYEGGGGDGDDDDGDYYFFCMNIPVVDSWGNSYENHVSWAAIIVNFPFAVIRINVELLLHIILF